MVSKIHYLVCRSFYFGMPIVHYFEVGKPRFFVAEIKYPEVFPSPFESATFGS